MTPGRRAELVAELRAVLVDGVEPTPRIAAAGALVAASGALPWFEREIPWNSTVASRAGALQQGEWGAAAIVVNSTGAATVIATR